MALLGVALAQAAPGPNLLAVASAGLGQGRRAALMTVAGVASGMLLWASAVAFGLAAIVALFPAMLTAMKLAGGAYLAWLALRSLLAALRGGAPAIRPVSRGSSVWASWRRGLLVVITNPKAALMWIAVGTFLFGSGLAAWQVVLFGPLAAISAMMIYGTYGVLFSSGLAVRAYAGFARWIELAFGAAFGALGGKLLFDGVREMRA